MEGGRLPAETSLIGTNVANLDLEVVASVEEDVHEFLVAGDRKDVGLGEVYDALGVHELGLDVLEG